LVAIGVSLVRLLGPTTDLIIERTSVGTTPISIYRSAGATPAPAVIIAHGFAGSRPLMEPFALALAKSGYLAVSLDFQGHGRNPEPLAGDITKESGATRALLAELDAVADFVQSLDSTDGRLAVLGHSMASDIVVRFARNTPDVEATVAVSMYSTAVTPTEPANLLIIVGGWERRLGEEALAAVGMVTDQPEEAVTYGNVADGSARRAAFADRVEHVGVLFSEESLREAVAWLDLVFDRTSDGQVDGRGPWIILLLVGVIVLARPLARLLPPVAAEPRGSSLPRRKLFWIALVPPILTPILLWPIEIRFLPMMVGDYLSVHFALYGVLTAGGMWLAGRGRSDPAVSLPTSSVSFAKVALGVAIVALYSVVALGLPIDRFVTSFFPIPERWPLVGALLIGTFCYFVADEWLTRGRNAPRGFYALTKVLFALSLALAVALDLEQLFFLIIITPVIVAFLVVYGFFSTWAYRATGHPAVGGFANALAFAIVIGATFPVLTG
jgi:pimeloyl-ACP methyl ester carboxylesterase